MTSSEILAPDLRFEGKVKGRVPLQPTSFEEVFVFSTGRNIKQAESSPEFAIPCVRYGELYHMYGEVITSVINRTNVDESELIFSDGDEILLPSAGEDPLDIGAASALMVKNVAIGRTINVLKPKEPEIYDQRFASYYINQKLRRKISTLARGASISNVYNSDLRKLNIFLPTLSEQQKIADFLTVVDRRISQLKEKQRLLETWKKGVMQQLFSQSLRFKDDNGQHFPDWEESELGQIATPVKNKNRNKAEELVLTNSATLGVVPQREYFDHDIANKNNLDGYYVVNENDFVYNPRISSSAPVGPIKRNKIGTGVMSPLYSVFRISNSHSMTFFEYFFETTCWHRYMNKIANFGARHDRMNVTNSDFYKMPVPIPDKKEQTKIANCLAAIDRKIDTVARQIDQTQTFKRGLLQQMFV